MEKQEDLTEVWEMLLELQALYREIFPPGTVSKDGKWIMGPTGHWQGRCVVIPIESEVMPNEPVEPLADITDRL